MALHSWLARPQRRLGPLGLIVLLVITSLVTPLSLDMYTPAVPHMTEHFNTSESMVNLTLVGYFLFFAVGLLAFGPASDRYGRKPVLLAGILTYALASALCALSVDIVMLIATRILQALGAGAVSAVSTAVVKDAVVPERREALLSVVQVMFVVGPVLAPVAGALILQVADWRMTFWVLAGIGLLCAGLALLFDETLPVSERYEGTVLGSVKQLGAVARNKGFSAFLGIVGLYNLPFMAYIAVGSYVYITFFGLTELEYSMYFAFAALLTAAGPFIWLAASRFMSARRFTSILLGIALASGAAMLAVGQASPQLFCITFLAFALTEAAVRPYSTNVLLSQQEGDTGAASSLIDLSLQIRRKAKEGELGAVETVYLGGGTPSHVGLAGLSMLLYTLSLSMHLTDEVECTMEANPESLTERMVRDIWALGVNRLSIGVQSFDDDVLRTLGRAHSSDDARRAIEAARTRFENVSVDLMCGIPGQSAESFEASVREAVRLGATHVSVYPLTIEPHTPFDAAVLAGELEEPDDDVEAAHMQIAARVLDSEGFERYEVASYARPGFACRHNIAYWTGVPYLGLGRSAATMTQNAQRRMRVKDGQVTDDLDPRQMVAEDLMLGMRMTAGVSDEHAARAAELLPEATTVLADLERQGLVEHEGGRWRPTERGWLCGNELYGALFDLAD